jgi:hypothetical protein
VNVPRVIRRGTDDEGYALELEEKAPVLQAKIWGFWSPATAGPFVQEVIDICNTSPRPTKIVIDAVGLKPQREVGQQAFAMLMGALGRLGITRVEATTDSSLTRLQLLRIAQENGARKVFHIVETKPQA